jgi:pimeloyl-ACP methyl ester carboxylesterase
MLSLWRASREACWRGAQRDLTSEVRFDPGGPLSLPLPAPRRSSTSPGVQPRQARHNRRIPTSPVIERADVLLHGHRVTFAIAGQGPPVVLIHGVAGRAEQWGPIISSLAQSHTVVAPDLIGHGDSAKPRGDYSLGAHASGIRDLLIGLNINRASIIGHSLGGGIAMQFAYQFPERCERLVLVSSGGLGDEVHPLLRAAALPGSEFVLPLLAHPRTVAAAMLLPQALGRLGLRTGPDLTEIARGYQSLSNAEARNAFIHTVRAVIDATGQRINASDRLYLTSHLPSLIIWGQRDRIIPVEHAHAAHQGMPGSRLEIFDDAGHFPQLNDPPRFAGILKDFLDHTRPAQLTTEMMHKLVRNHDPHSAAELRRLRQRHRTTPQP